MSADPKVQLEEKMRCELSDGHPYEAQQYVQTFVARKAKSLGQSKASALIFHGAKLLLESNSYFDAGALLVWFIEDGAGVDYLFHVEDSELSGDKYCDLQRLIDVLTGGNLETLAPCAELLYGPLHILASKSKFSPSGPASGRLNILENLFADIFEAAKKWNMAYKSVLRLNDIPRLAKVVDCWSKETYESEKPLFFARSMLQLLADKKIEQAASLAKISYNYVEDVSTEEGVISGPLAIWHCSVILSELALLPPMPRVDKAKLFGLLMQLYVPNLITRVDPKLVELLEKVGPAAFNYVTAASQQQAPNPMTLLQNMLTGGGAGAKAPGEGFDMNNMMAMLNQMRTNK
jgi:hypothetical protein